MFIQLASIPVFKSALPVVGSFLSENSVPTDGRTPDNRSGAANKDSEDAEVPWPACCVCGMPVLRCDRN